MLTKSNLLDRGWTDSLIKKFLGIPDQLKVNPKYKKAAPMRLYLEARVEQIEQSEEFLAATAKNQNRRDGAERATETKLDRTLTLVNDLPEPTLPNLTQQQLTRRAVSHYNQLWKDRGESKFETVRNDPKFLNRISTNYARHMLTDYERELELIFGRVGTGQAYMAIKAKMNEAIEKAYPWLADIYEEE